ncbi:MAG: 16S rRNA (cytosine(967)-C(5))-methyltransferase [Gammaproteobacteria bacterium]|nr:16S rRNA (cytosine(967)-C(5))-methyltransferase [Gammaproteobacteria bacterium]
MRNDDIRLASRLLIRVLRGESLEAAMEVSGAALASARIRAWVYGVCRHYFSVSEQLANICRTPLTKLDREVFAVLLIGVYQLTHSDAKPHAVVSESVEAIKRMHKQSAAFLVNAVLRKVDRDFRPASLSGKYELPEWLIEKLRAAYGEKFIRSHLACLNSRMPQCLRVNQRKISPQDFHAALRSQNIDFTILREDTTVRLRDPQPSRSIPGYSEGWFAVQDASAQMPVRELDLQPKLRVLDACAAPGNKAFQLLEHDVELTALDINPTRSAWCETESSRLGLPLVITEGDATNKCWWDGRPFDRILLDAPCSATGTIGRHPDVKIHRAPGQLAALQDRQVRLLSNLWDVLALEGVLVYATCSLLPEENDAVIGQLAVANKDVRIEPLNVHPSERPLIVSREFGAQIFPDSDWGDGFYLAKLRKAKPAS